MTSNPISLPAQVLRRAFIVAIVLGSVLTLANQSGAIFGPAPIQPLPLVLNYLTPLVVVGLSQMFGIRAARRASATRESFLATLLSHGIPARAGALGLAAGGINTAIIATAALMAGNGLDRLPLAVILPAVILPVLFGALSQALAFRSQAKAVSRPPARIGTRRQVPGSISRSVSDRDDRAVRASGI